MKLIKLFKSFLSFFFACKASKKIKYSDIFDENINNQIKGLIRDLEKVRYEIDKIKQETKDLNVR
jgi:hypothetical protein